MARLRRRGIGLLLVASAWAAPLACDDADTDLSAPDAAAGGGDAADAEADATLDAPPAPKGDRVLGTTLDLSVPSFFEQLQVAHDAGHVGTGDVSFAWDRVERPYDAGPDADAATVLYEPALHAVRLALESERLSIVLGLDVVDATGARLPADLAGRPLDDPDVVARVEPLVDYALGQLEDLPVAALVVGSDVDAALGDDASRWRAFGTLFARTAARAKAARPKLPVAFGVTAAGLRAHAIDVARVAAAADLVAVSYRAADDAARVEPASRVAEDVAALAAAAPEGKPVLLRAVGCPSSPVCGSDEPTQASIVGALFAGWDRARARMPIVVLAPLDDATEDAARAAAARLGRDDDAHVALFASLGLRTSAGRPKASLAALATAVRTRGF